MNDNIDKDEIRRAIDRLQTEHPCHFAFDATKFDSADNVDVVKRAIDNVMERIRDDADIHIICEMAKLYLDGVKPTVERPHGEWIPKQDNIGGTYYVCSNCGEPCHTLLYTEPEPRDRFCLWCGADMKEGETE